MRRHGQALAGSQSPAAADLARASATNGSVAPTQPALVAIAAVIIGELGEFVRHGAELRNFCGFSIFTPKRFWYSSLQGGGCSESSGGSADVSFGPTANCTSQIFGSNKYLCGSGAVVYSR